MRVLPTVLMLVGVAVTFTLAVHVGGFLGMMVAAAGVDLLATLFGKPLIAPGPLAQRAFGVK